MSQHREGQSALDAEMSAPVIEDKFRSKEKAVKLFMKGLSCEEKKQKKRKKGGDGGTIEAASTELFDWSEVIDIRAMQTIGVLVGVEKCASSDSGAEVYRLLGRPEGFYVVINALTPDEQLHWSCKTVTEYSKAEHTNLTNLARIYEEEQLNAAKAMNVAFTSPEAHPNELSGLWDASCAQNNHFESFKKLRWACVGYHYNWTRRAYVQDEHSAFPADLAALCSRVAGLVRESSPASELDLELDAEAGIINYYPLGTCMGGHLDDAEHELMRPIVSFSLGLSGLFLLGGSGKNSEPRALLLRAGDAVVMAGESRRCYHGVPAVLSLEQERLLSPSVPSTLLAPSSAPSAQQQVLSYLRGSRVNMNARQVRRKDGSAWVDKSGTGYVDA